MWLLSNQKDTGINMALLVPKIGLMVKGNLGTNWPSVQAEMASVLEAGREKKKGMNKRERREKKHGGENN